jgi:hypothetical protein
MPLVLKVCRFYGWTPDQVLKMDARHFFESLKEARKLHALDRRQEIEISAISICNSKYAENLRDTYSIEDDEIIEEQNVNTPIFSKSTKSYHINASNDPELGRQTMFAWAGKMRGTVH